MPERIGAYLRMEQLGRSDRETLDHEFQKHWYQHMTEYVRNKTVLDAGAGLGYGVRIMRESGAALVRGFDLASFRENVEVSSIEEFGDNSFDVVVAMDVIEHTENGREFLYQLLRVARDMVFFATPNYNFSKCRNEYHAREYTPQEVIALTDMFKDQWISRRCWVSGVEPQILWRGMTYDKNELACNFGVMLMKIE